jgi:hypothetical protein
LSARGSDGNPGTRRRPWRSFEKANNTSFKPGDRILLEGSGTIVGTLVLGKDDGGSPGRELVVSSFGTGQAVIDGGNGRAISIDGAHHVRIRNLKLIGAGRKTGNTDSGLYLANSAGAEVDRVEVSGFRRSGVYLTGVQDARITRVYAHENGFAGISSQGTVSRNLYVGDCLAENNPGDPKVSNNHSGNGIVLGNVRQALVERCEARYNGWDMPWTGNGPVGIWTHNADRVTIQFCIAHHNRSTATDGGGFDFDGGVTNSVMQYNYSHDNFGAGYLICQYRGAPLFENNTVRYNISQDDGLKAHDSGIYLWVGGANMKNTMVYNNTVFNDKGAAVIMAADPKFADALPKLACYNNIFYSMKPQVKTGGLKGEFLGNLYWSMGVGGFQVDSFDSLERWAAATGQERTSNRIAGRFADPLLRKSGPGLLTDPAKLASLVEYLLLPGSPAAGGGLDLRKQFGIDPGERDFFGNPLPKAGPFGVGAHQASVTASREPR